MSEKAPPKPEPPPDQMIKETADHDPDYEEKKRRREISAAQLTGLTFRRDADGVVWLIFESKRGLGALINLQWLAKRSPGVAGDAILDWIDDQP